VRMVANRTQAARAFDFSERNRLINLRALVPYRSARSRLNGHDTSHSLPSRTCHFVANPRSMKNNWNFLHGRPGEAPLTVPEFDPSKSRSLKRRRPRLALPWVNNMGRDSVEHSHKIVTCGRRSFRYPRNSRAAKRLEVGQPWLARPSMVTTPASGRIEDSSGFPIAIPPSVSNLLPVCPCPARRENGASGRPSYSFRTRWREMPVFRGGNDLPRRSGRCRYGLPCR